MNIINLSLFKAMTQNMAKTLLVAVTLSAATHSATATTRTFDEASANNSMKDAASNASGFRNLDDVVGLTLKQVKENAVDAEKYPEDMNKIFFLYNVKTGMFINTGGYWGTHISLKDYPLSLWVNTNSKYGDSTIELAQNMDTGQGHLLGWVGGTDTTKPDNGVFIDRRNTDNTHYGWTFEPVNDAQNYTYRIYTYATNNPTTSGDSQSPKYYLCANKGSVDQDKNCLAVNTTTINDQGLSGYDTWRIMSMQQIFELQKLNSDDMTSPLDVSYRLKCPGLSRGNKDIDKWHIRPFKPFGGNGGVRYGLERMYNKTNKVTSNGTSDTYDVENISTDKSYTFEDTKYTDKRNYLRHMAKYFCVDAKNIRGAIYQDVKVLHSGSYIVECKGYSSTPKAKLFAVRLDKDGKEVARTVHQTVLSQVSYMSEAEKEALHVDEQNMDYAGKEFYGSRKYINSVLVQIPEQTEDNYGYIRFGVIVGDDANDKQPVDGEWTVFDDFRLLYASRTIDEDLILDEDRSDLSYLTTCKNNYKNKVLHLKKSFKRDKWNSIVLPVKLTRDQFRQAFGANAKLAKLTSLTSDEIQFTSIDMNNMTTNDVVLDAYTPYIFFPTKYIAKNETPAYKALLTETGTEAKSHELVISDNHIEIPNITFEMNSENENDLSNIDTDTWTTQKMYSVGGNGTMEAHGTFARTFGTEATQDLDPESLTYGEYTLLNHDFFANRDNLIRSFFFYKGNLYYSNSRPHGLRGFTCWFKPTGGTLTKPMRLYLDGVADGTTTGIDTVVDVDNQDVAGKAVKGVFNLNGQRISNNADTTGLPAGMYIVNGKKCIVK